MGFRDLFHRNKATKELQPDSEQKPQEETNLTVIRDGDLFLKVRDRSTKVSELFRVNSVVMARNSPAFNRMINGHARVERPPHALVSWIITLEDTRPRQVEQFLQLIHGHFGNLTFGSRNGGQNTFGRIIGDIYHLLVITERYSCTMLLQPFATKIVDILDRDVNLRRRHLIMKAYVSFALGRRAHFEDTVTELILKAEPVSKAKPRTSLLVPSGLLDAIEHGRIEAAVRLLYPLVEQKRAFEQFSNHFCNSSHDFRTCEDRVLGSALQKLNKMGVWPDFDAENITASPMDLFETLYKIKTAPTPSSDEHPINDGFSYARDMWEEYGICTSDFFPRPDAFRYMTTPFEIDHCRFQTTMLRPWLNSRVFTPHWEHLQGKRILLWLSDLPSLSNAAHPQFFFMHCNGRGAFNNDDALWFSNSAGVMTPVRPGSWLSAHAVTAYWTEMLFSASKIQAALDALSEIAGGRMPALSSPGWVPS